MDWNAICEQQPIGYVFSEGCGQFPHNTILRRDSAGNITNRIQIWWTRYFLFIHAPMH